MFDTITGLPVHILVVHAVVVLGPLCALGTVVAAFSRTWFDRLSTVLVVLLGIAVLSALVARQSGLALRDRLGIQNPNLTRHAHLGTWIPLTMLVYWLLVVAWVWADRRRGRDAPLVKALMVLSVVAAVGTTALIVVTGDAGSRSVWEKTVQSTNR